MVKQLLGALLGLFCCVQAQASTVEVDLLGKLDSIEEHQADPLKRLTAKYNILRLLTKCEFDEQCVINTKNELERYYNEDKNVMYKAFLKYLEWEKKDLEYNLAHCQIDEKKAMRKIFAQCYEQWIEEEFNHPSTNRPTIDLREENRYRCIKEKAQGLAQDGNIFAQAEMVNISERFEASKEMSKWAAKIESFKDSPKYEQYMKCSELP